MLGHALWCVMLRQSTHASLDKCTYHAYDQVSCCTLGHVMSCEVKKYIGFLKTTYIDIIMLLNSGSFKDMYKWHDVTLGDLCVTLTCQWPQSVQGTKYAWYLCVTVGLCTVKRGRYLNFIIFGIRSLCLRRCGSPKFWPIPKIIFWFEALMFCLKKCQKWLSSKTLLASNPGKTLGGTGNPPQGAC